MQQKNDYSPTLGPKTFSAKIPNCLDTVKNGWTLLFAWIFHKMKLMVLAALIKKESHRDTLNLRSRAPGENRSLKSVAAEFRFLSGVHWTRSMIQKQGNWSLSGAQVGLEKYKYKISVVNISL